MSDPSPTGSMDNISLTKTMLTALILAGGEARRMDGQDKGMIKLNDKPLIEHVLTAISPQVGYMVINANRNLDHYAGYGCPVITDEFAGFQGPLAGMASGLRTVDTPFMVTVPCDSPFIPNDLVKRLYLSLLQEDAEISVAKDDQRLHPVFSLMKTTVLDSLLDFLKGGERKIDRWFDHHKLAIADFSDEPDTFVNINTPEELANIENKLKKKH